MDSYSKIILVIFTSFSPSARGMINLTGGSPPRTRVFKPWEKKNNLTSLCLTIIFSQIPTGITVDSDSVNRKFTVSLQTPVYTQRSCSLAPGRRWSSLPDFHFFPRSGEAYPALLRCSGFTDLWSSLEGCLWVPGCCSPTEAGTDWGWERKLSQESQGTEFSFRVQYKGVL